MSTPVSVDDADGVRTVTIDVPERRNALSRDVLTGVRAALSGIDDVCGVVLTGSGAVFSAGADFAELAGTAADTRYDDLVAETVAAIRAVNVPVTAAIEGPCLGAAVDVALACDLRVCAAGAWLQVPAVQLGILYNPRALARLHRSLPRDTLTRLVLFAERFTAESAERCGLATTLTMNGRALARARELTLQLSGASPDAVTATKRLLGALDDGVAGFADWEDLRESLLDSNARSAALDATRRRVSTAAIDNGDGSRS